MNFCSIKNLKEDGLTFLSKEKHIDSLMTNIKKNNITKLTVMTTEQFANRIATPEIIIQLSVNPRMEFFNRIKAEYKSTNDEIITRLEYPGVSFYPNVYLGKNISICPGAVIGSHGFGYERNELGEWECLPHIGGVVIEDNVEIGANTCIDRGAIDDTIIGRGTKIDNLVHVAHNVNIGKNCMLVCLCGIGGSVTIGDNVWVGMGAQIRNGLKIGNNVTIGMGAIVVKDVADGLTVVGNPAKVLEKSSGN